VCGRNVIEKKPLYVGLDLAIDSAFFMWAGEIARPKKILYASSSAAYPVNYQKAGRSRLLREDDIHFSKNLGIPDLTYGWSKLTGEFLAKIGVEKYGLSIGIVRPFSGYGEDQEPVYPFPAIALRVAARLSPVRVWGSGKQTRDFIHIQDACEACLAVCRNESKGGAYNIGSGIATSFLDLAKRMIKIEGYEADVVGTLGKPVGVAERICDPKKIKNKFGWKQKISLDEGIGRALSFAKMRLNSGIKPE
jgi:nucleoside-diphosphate-sugar epimerase